MSEGYAEQIITSWRDRAERAEARIAQLEADKVRLAAALLEVERDSGEWTVRACAQKALADVGDLLTKEERSRVEDLRAWKVITTDWTPPLPREVGRVSDLLVILDRIAPPQVKTL